jgi:cytoskeletal protein CcmA (bactofilin family)
MKKLNNNNPGSVVRNLEPGKENRNDEAPIPPKRNYKNRMHPSESSPATSFDDQHITSPGAVAGSGFNVPRRLGSQSANNAEQKERPYKKKHSEVSQELYNPPMRSELREELLSLSPDVVIGEGVEIKGNFQFDGLLRLDGRFHGQFQTQDGDVIVGPTGVLISDLTNINRLLVEGGHVSGKLHVAHITICGNAVIKGDIVSKNLEILDADATIIGSATVNPTALDPPEPPSPAKPQEPVSNLNSYFVLY